MKPERPYFLDLAVLRLPIGGMVSILHRISGAFLALSVPCLLYAFSLSLSSEAGYARVSGWLGGFFGWVLSMGAIWALLHHLLAGLRHLGLDLGLGEEKAVARQTAWIALLAAAGITALIALGRLS
ncbi:MAG: succinate dehydrogenase, cytochrome b556 subunit [Betaproteobacteria bacterium]|nr:succinate dehydrogenase, cytochrome b556 subunit [Betaproteobacteria bacterium]